MNTKIKKLNFGVLIILVSFILVDYSISAENCPKIIMKYNYVSGRNILRISIKNEGNEPIKIHRSSLPWMFSTSDFFMILAPTSEPYNQLQGLYPLSNPLGEAVILPNKVIESELNLDRYFFSLNDALEKDDINLFWSYRPDKGCSRQGGWILLPRHQGKGK